MLFTGIFEIYNLVSIIQSDRPGLGSIQGCIGLLGSNLSNNFKDTFMSKTTQGDTSEDGSRQSKRPRASHAGQGGILAMACSVASTSTTIARLSIHSLGQGTRWSRTMKTRMAGCR